MIDQKFIPFIEAVINPYAEEIIGLDELSTEEIVAGIKKLSDEEILSIAMQRPEHPGRYGFIYNRLLVSDDSFGDVLAALGESN